MTTIKSYQDLIVWQKSQNLALSIYLLTNDFPKEEKYGLTSQLKRASVSIPTNIAEGYNRKTTKDYIHFLYISRGSCAEVESLLHLCYGLKLIDQKKLAVFQMQISEIGKLLNGLISALIRKIQYGPARS